MKLRLEDNTLRLRLSPEEVMEFGHAGRLHTAVPLGPVPEDTLTYILERTTAAGPELQLAYTPGHITVLVPAALADEWMTTETISLRGSYPVAGNQVLHILVEKDLGCKH
ncbi:hypothetical protein KBK19_18700 [Microvirga sp. STR05]|uniref:Uncharacterized protein n=1 Tax=Hymenobacter duratus TaxID=2771356 RepID=A0ABR8JMG3_9BACT|nr:hypothetical protein [Hymenobacter duratus]MBD2717080.1 hypothetical protein [Hymenobacter duratus]MBR7951996.1 hypothetical protein [Microvirga sp. STR05]